MAGSASRPRRRARMAQTTSHLRGGGARPLPAALSPVCATPLHAPARRRRCRPRPLPRKCMPARPLHTHGEATFPRRPPRRCHRRHPPPRPSHVSRPHPRGAHSRGRSCGPTPRRRCKHLSLLRRRPNRRTHLHRPRHPLLRRRARRPRRCRRPPYRRRRACRLRHGGVSAEKGVTSRLKRCPSHTHRWTD